MCTFLRPVMTVCLLLFTMLFVAPPAFSEGLEVVVSGVGKTENSARQQAYRNAIQQVVGTLIVSDVLVQNNDVINDKILSHSDGYITKVEQVGPVRAIDGGLIEVTMKVTVKSEQLQMSLKTANITTVAVDGASLAAESQTKKEGKQDAPAIIAEIFKPLPASVVTAKADMSKATVKDSVFTLPVQVSIAPDAYKAFTAQLTGTFKKLGYKNSVKTFTGGVSFPFEQERRLMYPDENDFRAALNAIVVERVSTAGGNVSARISLFDLPESIFDIIVPRKGINVSVELLDAAGELVMDNQFTIHGDNNSTRVLYQKYRYGSRSGNVIIFPRLWVKELVDNSSSADGYYDSGDAARNLINVNFILDTAELARVKSARCTVSNID